MLVGLMLVRLVAKWFFVILMELGFFVEEGEFYCLWGSFVGIRNLLLLRYYGSDNVSSRSLVAVS